uniref:Damage-control phosphatase ARMT1-like metal-binding domain-containing protein n=1 Tax=Solanum lycopersicum TaxID=4081 RepID=A0A3Q7IIH8_SOLLC
MESSGELVPFPLLTTPIESNYRACTIPYRFPSDNPKKPTPTELSWIDLFMNSIPSFRKRAESDDSVPDAPIRAEKFAQRYSAILEDMKKDPESHGGPPDCILLCRLREQVLREVGFRDIFKKVKDEENAKAISLFKDVVSLNDAIEDEAKRVENLVRGIFAGNIFDLGSAKAVIFVDNSGADVILGILPFARELLRHGAQVVLAANDLPSINDVTYPELVEIISKLKDEHGKLIGVDTSNLLVANSGNDLPVIDLTTVSQELAYLASDADLVIVEGMGRGIETNLYARFKCDSLKIGMRSISIPALAPKTTENSASQLQSTSDSVKDSENINLKGWAEFAKNVSGEWDGFGADFSKQGEPIELPESVVPGAYREWEVKVFDWQTQCPTLARDDDAFSFMYKFIRLLPTVGCEADAATRYSIDERNISDANVAAFAYQSTGCYVAAWSNNHDGNYNTAPYLSWELEHCLIDPGDKESRVRIVQVVRLQDSKLVLQNIKVFCEHWYGPFRNGDQLGGCAIQDSAFASTKALDPAEVIGVWEGKHAISSYNNAPEKVIQELVDGSTRKTEIAIACESAAPAQ